MSASASDECEQLREIALACADAPFLAGRRLTIVGTIRHLCTLSTQEYNRAEKEIQRSCHLESELHRATDTAILLRRELDLVREGALDVLEIPMSKRTKYTALAATSELASALTQARAATEQAQTPKPLRFSPTSDKTGVRITVGKGIAPSVTLYARHLKEIGPMLGLDIAAISNELIAMTPVDWVVADGSIAGLVSRAHRFVDTLVAREHDLQRKLAQADQARDSALAMVAEQGRELAQLRTIVLKGLGVPEERHADYPLLNAAQELADAYDTAHSKAVNLQKLLNSECAANAEHVRARRMGIWVGLLAVVVSCITGLGIAGFFSRGLGK